MDFLIRCFVAVKKNISRGFGACIVVCTYAHAYAHSHLRMRSSSNNTTFTLVLLLLFFRLLLQVRECVIIAYGIHLHLFSVSHRLLQWCCGLRDLNTVGAQAGWCSDDGGGGGDDDGYNGQVFLQGFSIVCREV